MNSDDKMSRWLGFIQGVMCAKGWLDMETERASTRSVFHEAYHQLGWPVSDPLGRSSLQGPKMRPSGGKGQ